MGSQPAPCIDHAICVLERRCQGRGIPGHALAQHGAAGNQRLPTLNQRLAAERSQRRAPR
jgi:hypothetical protein